MCSSDGQEASRNVSTVNLRCHFPVVVSDLAGGSQRSESEPDGQLSSVPEPCCGGRPSLTRQQAQQPVFCPLCLPPGPLLPAWREQPLHCGQYLHLNCNFIAFHVIFMTVSFSSPPSGRSESTCSYRSVLLPSVTSIWVIQWKESLSG